MKKLIFFLLMVASLGSSAQITGFVRYASKNQHIGLAADTLFYAPVRDTFFTPQREGALTYRSTDKHFYQGISTVAGTKRWMKMATATDITGGVSYVDSIWRVPGIDSIYWLKDGNTYAILDSTGGGSGGTPTSRTINTTYPLQGGGDLSADRTFNLDTAFGKWRSEGYNDTKYQPIGSYVPTTRTLTINGTAQDLSANRSWSVGTLVGSDTLNIFNRLNQKHFSKRQIFLNPTITYNPVYFSDSYLAYWGPALDNYFGLTATKYQTSGASVMSAWRKMNLNADTVAVKDLMLMQMGYNDMLRAGGKTGGMAQFTNTFKSIISNWFLSSSISANDGSISYTGSWNSSFPDDSAALKSVFISGHSQQTTSSGATASYTFSGKNIVIGFGTTYGLPALDSFSVTIDGIDRGTYCFDSSNYNATDSGDPLINTNKKGVASLVFTELSSGSHTVVITKGTNTSKYLVIDYFGLMGAPSAVRPITVMGIPYFSTYREGNYGGIWGSTINNQMVDTWNQALEEVCRSFEYYPLSYGNINEYWQKPTDLVSDSIHPNANGIMHIANGFVNSFRYQGVSQWRQTGSDIYYSAGKVGVGTVPSYQFDELGKARFVIGTNKMVFTDSSDDFLNITTSANAFKRITITNGTSTGSAGMFLLNDAGKSGLIRFSGSANSTGVNELLIRTANGDDVRLTADAGFIGFNTGSISTERMRILVNGNVGIGMTAPDSMFQVLNGIYGQRGLRLPNLPVGKKAKQLYWDTDGTIYQGDSTGTGGGSLFRFGIEDSIGNARKFHMNGNNFTIYNRSDAANILLSTSNPDTSAGARLYLGGDSTFQLRNNAVGVRSNAAGNKLQLLLNATSSDTTVYKPIGMSSDGTTVQMNSWPVGAGVGGSGTVNTGAANKLAYYPSAGTTVDDASGLTYGSDVFTNTGSTYGDIIAQGVDNYAAFFGGSSGAPSAIYWTSGYDLRFGTTTSLPHGGFAEKFRLKDDGSAVVSKNFSLISTSWGSSASGVIALGNGTAPGSSITDGVQLYSQDVSASAELKVRDEAGNITVLSPHDFSGIPGGRSEDLAWSFYSEKEGKYISVDMAKAMRTIEELTERVSELELKNNIKPKKAVKLVYTGQVTNKPNPKNK